MSGNRGPRGEAMAEARRWEILGAAVECFSWNGYGGTTISAIAERAGLSHGLIHHYYGSKAELFVACIEAGLAYVTEVRQLALAEEHPPEEQLRRWAHGISNAMSPAFLFSRLILQATGAPGSHPPECLAVLDRYHKDEAAAVVPWLIASGHAPIPARDRHWLAFAGIFGARVMGMWRADPTLFVQMIYRQACYTLGVSPVPEPSPLVLPAVPWPQEIKRTPWAEQ